MKSKSLFQILLTAALLAVASVAQALDPIATPVTLSLGKSGYLIQSLRDVDSLEVEFLEEQANQAKIKTIAVTDEVGFYVQVKVTENPGDPQWETVSFEQDIVNFKAEPKENGFGLHLPPFTDANYRYVFFIKSETDPVNGGPLYYLRPGSDLLLRSPNSTLGARLLNGEAEEVQKIETATEFTQDEPGIVWLRFTQVQSADLDLDGLEGQDQDSNNGTPEGQKPVNGGVAGGDGSGWTCSLQAQAASVQDILVPGGFLIMTLARSLRRKPKQG